jgi:hypothetical protein
MLLLSRMSLPFLHFLLNLVEGLFSSERLSLYSPHTPHHLTYVHLLS